jgi:diazepam-binding inhibitor (GABA receptor modulating acyl-CoA-binding protein)
MSDLKTTFEAAVANSKNLSERPDNATLLKIYALYKQAPLATTPTRSLALATWWAAPSGMPGTPQGHVQDDAMQQYIDLIESLS